MSGFNLLGQGNGSTGSGFVAQNITMSISAASLELNVPIQEVDVSRSFVLVNYILNIAELNVRSIRAEITSSNNVRLTRQASGYAIDVNIMVVTLPNVRVQSGLLSFASNQRSNSVVLETLNPNYFVVASYSTPSGTTVSSLNNFTTSISGNTLTISASASGVRIFSYFVIESLGD